MEKVVAQLPQEAAQVLKTYPEDLHGRLPREHADMLKTFFSEISNSQVYIYLYIICEIIYMHTLCYAT